VSTTVNVAAADWLDSVKWDAAGLVPAIAQDAVTNEILMVAWMNREALAETAATLRGVYFSRSRQRLWRKGEESGHFQIVSEIRLDCDNDVVLLKIEQVGGIACHTGRRSCFFQKFAKDEHGVGRWVTTTPVLKNPDEIYR
jgi:phosphoribosyl-AMP cyclohydrolase